MPDSRDPQPVVREARDGGFVARGAGINLEAQNDTNSGEAMAAVTLVPKRDSRQWKIAAKPSSNQRRR
jgi:hypothetical protein